MIYILLLCLFCFLLPTIHFKEVVDEQKSQRKFVKFKVKDWKNPVFIYRNIAAKLYGAWTFKTREMDRLSIILAYLLTVLAIDWVFGFKVALLFSTMPMTLFTSVWRNGRRYNLSVLLSVLVSKFGIWLYPLVAFTQVSAAPAFLLTPYWWLAPILYWPLRSKINLYKHKVSDRPRVQKVWRLWKLIPMMKTLAHFVYRTLIPGRVFMYEDWYQSYGTNKMATRMFFEKDGWFWSGVVISCLLAVGLVFEPTRFGVWWFIIFYLPFSNFVTTFQHNNTRYMVLPALGLWIALSQFIPLCVCLLFAAIQFMYSVMSVRMFNGNEEFYNYHFDYSPRSIAPYYIMAKHFVKNGDHNSALEMLRRLFDLVPYHFGGLLLLLRMPVDNKKDVLAKIVSQIPDQTFCNRKDIKSQIKNLHD